MARKRDIPGARKVRKTLENKVFLQIAQGVIYENVPRMVQTGLNRGAKWPRSTPTEPKLDPNLPKLNPHAALVQLSPRIFVRGQWS
jgi:hypothetical protein